MADLRCFHETREEVRAYRPPPPSPCCRVVYEELSKDPNSLANLDQDLPNYAQHTIRIHSLPQVRQRGAIIVFPP